MIIRLLILAALAWLAWRLLQQWQAKLQKPPEDQANRPAEPGFELMQRCKGCGAYLPAQALSRSGRCGRCSD